MLRDHYIFSNGRLKRKDNTVYFENEQGQKKALPIEAIQTLHLFGEIDLNSKFLTYISQYGISLQFYNYYGFYAGAYHPKEKKESGLVIVKQSAHYLDRDKRQFLAYQFLQGAVHHMLRNLRRHKESVQTHIDEIELIAQKLQFAKDIQSLMGIEGQIRHIYYQSFNHILKQDFLMEKREKQPPRDPLNALISFGNTLMYTAILGEIYKTPLNPTISYLHEPSVRRFSLCLDIAEIFKPLIVDSIIFALINKKSITKKHFEYLEKEICYLNEEGKKRFITAWEEKLGTSVKHRTLNRNTTYRYLLRLECYKLVKHVIDDQVYKPLKAWW
ncbi:subtype I-B CRISPR-associated endonuclease Cas1 [Desulfuribacillus stibiiarsenatis]|uniref:CRISPR-associated endonuclease Cas1 n=1 Tax=Desulfuribacillus stibiiarsenatis TaxID=1390249 RepID=A0A1E5L446_9FIRM|nr:type I-B CRISPR-associated endonuclease Cas1b [Desulfuribacillus stibiiarsenatis]OEH84885.1 subtype I-B CRISPR-associated endonuclease Cas1 [Desulfuribacillus stibiiarsenatis]